MKEYDICSSCESKLGESSSAPLFLVDDDGEDVKKSAEVRRLDETDDGWLLNGVGMFLDGFRNEAVSRRSTT